MRLFTARIGLALAGAVCMTVNSISGAPAELESPPPTLWQDGIGNGFRRDVQTLAVQAGVNFGLAEFGSVEVHHLALASVSYGHMLGPLKGGDHWHRGNWEFRAELFAGGQFHPESDWLVGLTPHLRYNFATGTRWVPFIDGGAGVTVTSIGPPDLSNTFEFNLQGTIGTHYLIRPNVAFTAEARYIHLSCAGITLPNNGLNGVTAMLGLTWLF